MDKDLLVIFYSLVPITNSQPIDDVALLAYAEGKGAGLGVATTIHS